MDKLKIRSTIKEQLDTLSEVEFKKFSAEISNKLMNYQLWKEADVVALTISRGKEVETKDIIDLAWKCGKIVVVPKCDPVTKRMSFRKITSFDQLETVYFGLKEPIVEVTEEIDKAQIDLIIVPGICFNRKGYRIGYGGGYYDRFLADFKGDTLSIAFQLQIVENIQLEPHDIPVEIIITEKEVIECRD